MHVSPKAGHLGAHDHDPGERLDPAGGPEDEEDPDLRETDWDPYDPYNEGEDEDPEDVPRPPPVTKDK
ncbi:MAG: hypothetical protein JWN52_5294 [Actinomycetia bacterium]|nr:hypothetical protein [Actinomycetes bacterium]